MIKVGRASETGAALIDRNSYLGNPFGILGESRSRSVENYHRYFNLIMSGKEPIEAVEIVGAKTHYKWLEPTRDQFIDELKTLENKDSLTLGCHCSPLLCHGDIIKNYLNKRRQDERK